jgi:hypothetical protein
VTDGYRDREKKRETERGIESLRSRERDKERGREGERKIERER